MRLIAAVVFLLASFELHAQTCPAAPADPIARDALRLNWNAVTTWTVPPGGNIPTPTQVTYTVYKMVGTTATLQCTTTALSAGVLGLPVGDACFAITAKTALSNPPNTESGRTATVCRTIPPPLTTPAVPGGFTVTGTIELNIVVTPNP